MPASSKHPEVRPRGFYAARAKAAADGGDVRFVQVSPEVWEAFNGDQEAISDALVLLSRLVKSQD